MAHQFSHIGTHAMVGAGFKIVKDVPPYILAGREPVSFEGVNRVGLSRRGFSEEKINEIKDIYETLFLKGMNVSDACAYIEENFAATEERDTILNFIRNSKRGIISRPRAPRR
jgi:Acyl-[acyl carrier protein]--UDP-N-acetylglucosamine O-acyltransferase